MSSMSIDISSLQNQVQLNCHISDANYSGTFSLCMLLLRLRNLYKWEVDMPPWQEPPQGELLQWVENRENMWLDLEGRSPEPLEVGGESLDSLEASQVNALLAGSDLHYGAGLVTGMKPSYFLGRVVEKRLQEGMHVCIVDQELARDIFSVPLMRQGDLIMGRRRSMATLLWDEILELRASSARALAFAFDCHGLNLHRLRRQPGSCRDGFLRACDAELETWVYHEIGESLVDVFPGDLWQRIVSEQAGTLVEFFARTVRDILADTCRGGLLDHVIKKRRSSSLGFYAALTRPLSRIIYPQIVPAVQDFMQNPDWKRIEEARRTGYQQGRELALHLLDIYQGFREEGPEKARDQVIERVVRPLGILDSLESENLSE
ncbi:Sfum_1244 family protein [Desulfonatronospira sp.]|uniref:Sfum_1244 family protein n=1 Tax=Desulfonatronospira sp. TaxID=1962951 RepID=UPI0025BB6361|nr:Sfum_1244 family protein [Desulfonatronospira sp.]